MKLSKGRETVLIILLIIAPVTAGSLNWIYANAQQLNFDNGTSTDPESPGASYAAFLTAISSIIIAIIALVREVLKSRQLQGYINNTTLEQLDLVQSLLQKFVAKSEISKQFADIIYYVLLPEEAKKVVDANAIKIEELNKMLEKDTIALNEMTDLIRRWKEREITDPVQFAELAKAIVARSQHRLEIPRETPEIAHKFLYKAEYRDVERNPKAFMRKDVDE